MLRKLSKFVLIATIAMTVRVAWAGDVDLKLTTADGTTKVTVQDSGGVEVSSVNSDGNAYFNSITQLGTGGNVILTRDSLQSGATFYVSSGTIANQLVVGRLLAVGTNGANADNYLAVPMTAGAAISAKAAVVMSNAGTINTTAVASSVTVVGVAVTATSGANQTIMVAINGMVSGVTCQAALGAGARACTGTVAGQISTCASATNDAAGLGKMVTACAAGGTGTVLLLSH